jgi:hypothetical protein
MRGQAWLLILPMFFGCSGKNVVSGDDKTNAEKLAADLPSWCEQTCQRLEVCDSSDGCDCQGDACECTSVGGDDCVANCKDGLGKFAKDEACADTGRAYQACIDTLGCAELSSKSRPACIPDEDAIDACDEEEADDTPPQGVPSDNDTSGNGDSDGSSTGGTPSYGGPIPGPAPSPGPAVHCTDADGGGSAGSAGSANMSSGPYVTCQQAYGNCTNGHEYSWICIDEAQGQSWCTCFLDGDPVGAFTPAIGCPGVSEVNAACSWNLQSF